MRKKPEKIINDKKTRKIILEKLLEAKRANLDNKYLEMQDLLEMKEFKKVVNIGNSYNRVFEFNLDYLEQEKLIERKGNTGWAIDTFFITNKGIQYLENQKLFKKLLNLFKEVISIIRNLK